MMARYGRQWAPGVAACLLAVGMLLAATAPGGNPAAASMLAGATLAGALLAAALLLAGGAAQLALASAVQPRLARAMRANALETAYLRVTDPATPGRSRPRAPSAAPAAAAR